MLDNYGWEIIVEANDLRPENFEIFLNVED
jgi:hypothetical protein